jgi:predicted alpha/beta hydrolase family esterase
MKNAIILHGTGDMPDMFWFPYVKKSLEANGYQVWLPQLPNAECPNLKEWLPFILDNGSFTDETIIIGHSAGAQVILSLLEKIDVKIKQAILVSGYATPLRYNSDSKEAGEYEWDLIKTKAKQFVFINSDNDPWHCTDIQGRIMLDHLGGVQVIPRGEGHMGSQTHSQPYKEFPLLVRLIDKD